MLMKIIMNTEEINTVFNGCLEEKLQIYNSKWYICKNLHSN